MMIVKYRSPTSISLMEVVVEKKKKKNYLLKEESNLYLKDAVCSSPAHNAELVTQLIIIIFLP